MDKDCSQYYSLLNTNGNNLVTYKKKSHTKPKRMVKSLYG